MTDYLRSAKIDEQKMTGIWSRACMNVRYLVFIREFTCKMKNLGNKIHNMELLPIKISGYKNGKWVHFFVGTLDSVSRSRQVGFQFDACQMALSANQIEAYKNLTNQRASSKHQSENSFKCDSLKEWHIPYIFLLHVSFKLAYASFN